MPGLAARSMRIAYFAHLNDGSASGVLRKLAGQAATWRADGHAVRVFVATRDRDGAWATRLGDSVVRRYGNAASRLSAMTGLVAATRDFRPDLVYVRWDLFYPQMLLFPRRAPLVAEVNSDDLHEYALGGSRRARYNAWTRGLLLHRARALVFVTSELAAARSFRDFGALRRVVTNGIDLAAYPSLPAPVNDHPRLAFVGTARQPWHGIDKVLRLAVLRPGWQFDIVGMDAGGFEATCNVSWHGSLDRPRVLGVLAQADVGIGTLALHRKSMTEACPLKVREYLAVGLPVMYGYTDPDADRLKDHVLRIPNCESNVEEALADIDAFVLRSMGARVPRSDIAHLDLASKEAERLALFADIAQR